jgi:hypothetical protein
MTGICRVCWAEHVLRADGRIRGHGPTREACPGSYLPPVGVDESEVPRIPQRPFQTQVRRARAAR